MALFMYIVGMTFEETRTEIEKRGFKVIATMRLGDLRRYDALRGRGRRSGRLVRGQFQPTPEKALESLLAGVQRVR